MRLLIILMFSFSMLLACKKEVESKECNISKIVGFYALSMYGHPDSSVTTIEYNNNKVIKSIERIKERGRYESTIERFFEYSDGKLTSIRTKYNGVEGFTTITYDANNNVSAIEYPTGKKMSYFYADNKLIRLSYRHVTNNLGLGEYDTEFFYSGDNIVKVTETWVASGATNVWVFSYTDIPNTHFKSEFFPHYFESPYNFHHVYALSKNLVSNIESSVGGKYVYNYTFTSGGKVSSVTEIFTLSTQTFTKKASYEYSCP